MPGCIFKPRSPAVFAFSVSWSLLLHSSFFLSASDLSVQRSLNSAETAVQT